MRLDKGGDWQAVGLPQDEHTPIPGVMLFANSHHHVIRVMPDGRIVDLLEVHRLAEDAMRNGFNGDPVLDKPGFIADWKKMTALTKALNGKAL